MIILPLYSPNQRCLIHGTRLSFLYIPLINSPSSTVHDYPSTKFPQSFVPHLRYMIINPLYSPSQRCLIHGIWSSFLYIPPINSPISTVHDYPSSIFPQSAVYHPRYMIIFLYIPPISGASSTVHDYLPLYSPNQRCLIHGTWLSSSIFPQSAVPHPRYMIILPLYSPNKQSNIHGTWLSFLYIPPISSLSSTVHDYASSIFPHSALSHPRYMIILPLYSPIQRCLIHSTWLSFHYIHQSAVPHPRYMIIRWGIPKT